MTRAEREPMTGTLGQSGGVQGQKPAEAERNLAF